MPRFNLTKTDGFNSLIESWSQAGIVIQDSQRRSILFLLNAIAIAMRGRIASTNPARLAKNASLIDISNAWAERRLIEGLNAYARQIDKDDFSTLLVSEVSRGVGIKSHLENALRFIRDRASTYNFVRRDSLLSEILLHNSAEMALDFAMENATPSDNETVLWGQSYLAYLLEHIRNAKKRVFIAVAGLSFSREKKSPVGELLGALRNAHDRGIAIFVLLTIDNDFTDGSGSKNKDMLFRWFGENGIANVAFIHQFIKYHSKICIIDDNVIVGSHNWSRNSLLSDNELSMAVESEAFAEEAVNLMNRIFLKSAGPSFRR